MNPHEFLFTLANTAVLPFWVVLIGWPHSALGRWVRRWQPGVVLVALCYAWLIVPTLPQVLPLVANPQIVQLLPLLSTPQGFVAIWLHVLAFDLLAAGWLVDRATAQGFNPWLRRALLLLTLLFGPLGVLSYLALEAMLPQKA